MTYEEQNHIPVYKSNGVTAYDLREPETLDVIRSVYTPTFIDEHEYDASQIIDFYGLESGFHILIDNRGYSKLERISLPEKLVGLPVINTDDRHTGPVEPKQFHDLKEWTIK